MTSEPVVHPETTASHQHVCPYFGLEDDPYTRLLFAAPHGFCHRARPSAAVHFEHQQTHCLTAKHKACPVFVNRARTRLPVMLQQSNRHHRPYRRLWPILAVVALTAVAALAALFGGDWMQHQIRALAPIQVEPAIVLTDTPESQITETTATATPTALPATTTPTATQTATPTPLPSPSRTPLPTATPTPTPPLTPTAIPIPPAVTFVEVHSLNIHAAPDEASPILHQLGQTPSRFSVMGQSVDGVWWQVCCVEGKRGWLVADAVKGAAEPVSAPSPEPEQTAVSEPMAVIIVPANLRTGPGQRYLILEIVSEGASYQVIGRLQTGNWWQVCCVESGATAWVFGESVDITGSVTDVPVITDIPPSPTLEP